MPHTTILLCNGDPPPAGWARRLVRQADRVVAADGGANSAHILGITPDVIIGDLDSVTAATRRAFAGSHIVRIQRQDSTDLEKALNYLVDHGAERVVILGATGRRLDMTLANLSVGWNYVRSLDLVVAGEGWHAIPILKDATFAGPRGTTVSLIPFGPCEGVTLRGLQYPLRNARLRVGEVGVSNVTVRDRFRITIRRGKALVVILDDHHRWQMIQ